MSERIISKQQKNVLKKTTNKISHFLSSKKTARVYIGAVAMVTVFLMQFLNTSGVNGTLGNTATDLTGQLSQTELQTDDAQPASPSASVDSAMSSNTSTTFPTSTEVTVNGVQVPVPENGSVEQTITDEQSGNQSTVKIDVDSSSSSNTDDNDGSSRVRVRSRSNTDVRIRTTN